MTEEERSHIISEGYAEALDKTAKEIYHSLKNDIPKMIRENKKIKTGFYKRLNKMWKTPLDMLEALLIIADSKVTFVISGTGDVIEPEHDVWAIGSGGCFAEAAARALIENTELGARDIVEKSLNIAGDICIYTNHNLRIEELDAEPKE